MVSDDEWQQKMTVTDGADHSEVAAADVDSVNLSIPTHSLTVEQAGASSSSFAEWGCSLLTQTPTASPPAHAHR
jgi:hypothetical protein